MSVASPTLDSRRRLTLRLGALGIAVMAAVPIALVGGFGSASATQGVVRVIGPASNLAASLHGLHAGDTLRLLPGTYPTNYLRMYNGVSGVYGLNAGTAAAPITVTASDPSNPPLLYGGLQLSGARYWHLDHLRMQATVATRSALYLAGGIGWSVTNSEFWGASATGAFANVAIAGTGGEPSHFSFVGNCLHGAATNSTSNSDQNLYVSYTGTPTTGGAIARNIIWGSPHGEAIKLGDGGAAHAPGPWNVVVTNNTLYVNGRQLLFTGDVRNNRVLKNLFVRATAPFTADPRTTQIYIAGSIGGGNLVEHNYSFVSSMFAYDPAHVVKFVGNVQSSASPNDPHFTTVYSCAGFHPTNPKAAPYGRYGTTT